MIVINLYAGPCSGKSTLAADIFAKLKREGVQAEIPPEVAKIRAQRGDTGYLADQLAVFADTHHQLNMTARSGADVAILDSPLLLSLVYAPDNYFASFPLIVRDVYDRYRNIDYFLSRSTGHTYSEVGRVHNEMQAWCLDAKIMSMMESQKLTLNPIDSSEDSARDVVKRIVRELSLISNAESNHQRSRQQ